MRVSGASAQVDEETHNADFLVVGPNYLKPASKVQVGSYANRVHDRL